jgi:hypothetical protein
MMLSEDSGVSPIVIASIEVFGDDETLQEDAFRELVSDA